MNILIADLMAAATPVMAHALNAMPSPAKLAVAQAMEDGGWCELRVGLMNNAATLRVVLCNVEGKVVEIAKLDFQS